MKKRLIQTNCTFVAKNGGKITNSAGMDWFEFFRTIKKKIKAWLS